jgi:hypothetical protein
MLAEPDLYSRLHHHAQYKGSDWIEELCRPLAKCRDQRELCKRNLITRANFHCVWIVSLQCTHIEVSAQFHIIAVTSTTAALPQLTSWQGLFSLQLAHSRHQVDVPAIEHHLRCFLSANEWAVSGPVRLARHTLCIVI